MTPELWTGVALGVCGFAWLIVFILAFEAGIRAYGRRGGPPNERHDPHVVGWKPPYGPWSDDG